MRVTDSFLIACDRYKSLHIVLPQDAGHIISIWPQQIPALNILGPGVDDCKTYSASKQGERLIRPWSCTTDDCAPEVSSQEISRHSCAVLVLKSYTSVEFFIGKLSYTNVPCSSRLENEQPV